MPIDDTGSIPQQLGRFDISRVLGRGGMGIVYLAMDPVIGRQVAIKVLRMDPALSSEDREELRGRFEQEFRSAGTLSHPNIVTVYDVAQDGGTSFIAMEYVSGESLADLLKKGRELTFEQLGDFASQLCSGLDYAHEAGIVHRDVKPGNILFTSRERVKITDFGVAKVVSADLTRTGIMIGTPSYMSPEQVTGQAITGASDQFSAAVILYQILTGELPFSGENPTTTLYKIVHQDPIAPTQLNRALPKEVDEALARALKKDPRERYATCSDLAKAIRLALGVEPVYVQEGATGTVTLTRGHNEVASGTYGGATSWWRQEGGGRAVLIMAAVVALAVAVWFASSKFRSPPSPPQPEQEEAAVTTVPVTEQLETIAVRANRPGAEIWLDGKPTGQVAPASIEVRGQAGDTVEIALQRAGRQVASHRYVLGEGDRELLLTEPPRVERFSVQSEPSGAEVVVNGSMLQGRTPADIELIEGKAYTVEVRLDGYEPNRYSFTFPDDLKAASLDAQTLRFPLERAVPPGYLVVPDAPYPVTVDVAGRQYGPSTLHRIELTPGHYSVRASAPSVFYRREWAAVDLESEEEFRLVVPEAVPVRITTHPGNSRVSIDGRFADEAPFDQALAVGTHEFTVEWPSEGRKRTVTERITRNRNIVLITLDD